MTHMTPTVYRAEDLKISDVAELEREVDEANRKSLVYAEEQLQRELTGERPDTKRVHALMEMVEEVKFNAPILVTIVTLLAALLVTVNGQRVSIGRDGGVEEAIGELRMGTSMRGHWADRCQEAQNDANERFWGTEDAMATAMMPAWALNMRGTVITACECDECWTKSPGAKQRWFRERQEYSVRKLLHDILRVSIGRGASQSKIVHLLVFEIPFELLHGVPRCPNGRSERDRDGEGSQGADAVPMLMPDMQRFQIRTYVQDRRWSTRVQDRPNRDVRFFSCKTVYFRHGEDGERSVVRDEECKEETRTVEVCRPHCYRSLCPGPPGRHFCVLFDIFYEPNISMCFLLMFM
jgi:hypothetical protein